MNSPLHILYLGVSGFISGILSFILGYAYLLHFPPQYEFIKNVPTATPIVGILAGTVFGVSLGIYFLSKLPKKYSFSIKRLLFFVLVSMIAAYLAWIITYWASTFLIIFGVIPGGMIGGLIVALGFSSLVSPIRIRDIFLISVVGGLLGLTYWTGPFISLPLFKQSTDIISLQSLFSLEVLWQTGIALLFGFATIHSSK